MKGPMQGAANQTEGQSHQERDERTSAGRARAASAHRAGSARTARTSRAPWRRTATIIPPTRIGLCSAAPNSPPVEPAMTPSTE